MPENESNESRVLSDHEFPPQVLKKLTQLSHEGGAGLGEGQEWFLRHAEHLWQQYALEHFAGKAEITDEELQRSYDHVLARLEEEIANPQLRTKAAGYYGVQRRARTGEEYRDIGT